jgi:hypothetical protein
VVFFVREICETHPSLRPSILERLADTFSSIRASRVVSSSASLCFATDGYALLAVVGLLQLAPNTNTVSIMVTPLRSCASSMLLR